MDGWNRAAATGARIDSLLAPYVIAVVLYVPLLILFLATPASVFVTRYASTKHSSLGAAVYYALAVACFAIGALVGDVMARGGTRPQSPSERVRPRLHRLCLVALLVAGSGYVIWFGLAVSRAGGVRALVDTYRSDPSTVRNVYFATIPGVTTLTQVAIGAIALTVAYGLHRRRPYGALVAVLVVLAGLLAVLASERLAVIELLIPIAYLALAGRRTSPRRLAAAIAIGVLLVVAFFSATEIARTDPYRPFALGDAVYRFFDYYLSSINNSFVLAARYSLATPLYFVTQAIWQFPGAAHFGLTYQSVSGLDAPSLYARFYEDNHVTPSVSTFGLPGDAVADFGWAAPLWLLGLGGAVGAVYRAGARHPFYRALYAVWLVGVLDFVRVDYFTNTRVVPTYAVFVAAFVLIVRGRPEPDPRVRTPIPDAEGVRSLAET